MWSSLLWTLACSSQEAPPEPEAAPPPDISAELSQGEASLVSGDWDQAARSYAEALTSAPGDPEAASGAAYIAYLKGDLEAAETLLASAGEVPEVLLRRALIAVELGDLEAASAHAEASGTPAGALIRAEILLGEADPDAATELLTPLTEQKGGLAEAAESYLRYLSDEDLSVAALAENHALWALGLHDDALQTLESVLSSVPNRDWRSEELLLWSSRAATARQVQLGSNLLESIPAAPPGQHWRIQATRAILHCAEGDAQPCSWLLQDLEGSAPPLGLLHARATAASLLGPDHKELAMKLLDERVSDVTARVALQIAGPEAALRLAPEGALRSYLTGSL